jgi:recombinational DNA repair ATPase RecF
VPEAAVVPTRLARLLLNHLTSTNFRNLAEETVSFHPRANILVGRNGQGKTNVLEAIYFLATTKSFRSTRVQPLFRFGAESVFVSGRLERGGLEKSLSVGLEAAEGRKRVLMVNGEKVTLGSYLEQMTVFAYSSARLDVLRGTPEERRRFLDRGIASVQPGYLTELTRYGRVLRQRNALLAEIAQGRESPVTLEAWDEELRRAAEPLHRARGEYAVHLAEELRLVEGRPAADVLSGGEQKMIVLFLKFAKIELYRRRQEGAPVFLLDDVDAELDLEILQDLLSRLPEATQVFATSAKEAFLASLEAGPHRRLAIENGRVSGWHDFA